MDSKTELIKIDYALLMDLRVDFAFKTFVEGNPDALISPLNAVFFQHGDQPRGKVCTHKKSQYEQEVHRGQTVDFGRKSRIG